MKHHFFKLFTLSISLLATVTNVNSEERPPNEMVPLGARTTGRKKMPAQHRSFISYTSPEACLSTSMPYTYAVVEAADQDGNVYSSMMVTPEESCGYFLLQPSSTITVTFDNGVTLQGEN